MLQHHLTCFLCSLMNLTTNWLLRLFFYEYIQTSSTQSWLECIRHCTKHSAIKYQYNIVIINYLYTVMDTQGLEGTCNNTDVLRLSSSQKGFCCVRLCKGPNICSDGKTSFNAELCFKCTVLSLWRNIFNNLDI